MKNLTLVLSLVFLIFISCEKEQPSCSAPDVKNLAQEIIEEELIVSLSFSQYIDNHYLKFLNEVVKNSTDMEEIVEEEKEKIRKELNNPNTKDSRYTPFIEKIKTLVYDEMKMEITNIRVSDINKELQKCNCKAQIVFTHSEDGDTKSEDISYIVQINDEGETFVEVLLEDEY